MLDEHARMQAEERAHMANALLLAFADSEGRKLLFKGIEEDRGNAIKT